MVRVLIERRVAEGMIESFNLALRNMRLQATRKEGYISGESLRDCKDAHHFLVISTWVSRDAWFAWEGSEERRKEMASIGPMLAEPEAITVLEPV